VKAAIALAALLLNSHGCVKNVPVPAEAPLRSDSTMPQVLRFTAYPHIIHPGDEVLISWNARNAPHITLEKSTESANTLTRGEFLESIGDFPPDGTLRVSPKVTTTYVISCGNETIGCASASVTVTVKRPR